jgi:TonB-linked SusC/RagA family outer membrane protein
MKLKLARTLLTIVFCLFSVCTIAVMAQKNINKHTITGIIRGTEGEPLIGASIVEKGKSQNGTITENSGKFSLSVSNETVLFISYIGYDSKEVKTDGQSNLIIVLKENKKSLDEVVVVGYGTQKKESVVGAISQVKGDVLMQSGGVSTVGQALQGKLPGVTALYTNGQPGSNAMEIFIRGQSSWNATGPLILVDGIERDMNSIDMNEIEDLTVLKDASATAVYGVKGANGVVLLTTKRGKAGKAQFSVSANTSYKSISKVPQKLDSYDAMMVSNEAIGRELMYNESAWSAYTPVQVANKYRNQTTQSAQEIYPNVDWQKYMYKDFGNDYRLNASVSGGSDFAKYFCNIAYDEEGDITKNFNTGKGYTGTMNYKRFNYRSNLDFNITKSTTLSVNVSGSYGIQNTVPTLPEKLFLSLYNLAPDLYYPRYSDGSYGSSPTNDLGTANTLMLYTSDGLTTNHTFDLTTDFLLNQKLDFITKGLSAKGRFSFDNKMVGTQTISEPGTTGNNIQSYYVNDGTSRIFIYPTTTSGYSYIVQPWSMDSLIMNPNKMFRRIDYQLSLNYDHSFGKHNVTGLFLFKREEYATGSEFPHYSEDWVGRVTYNYNKTYFIEMNGAYNGSEKFGPGYRFQLFPSVAMGWMISNEPFMKGLEWLDKLKIRGSYGLVGDDGGNNIPRWLNQTQWKALTYGAYIVNPGMYSNNGTTGQSPYLYQQEVLLGNPDIHWETSTKKDLGLEISVLNGEFKAEVDYFGENRRDIYIASANRSLPDWFGAKAPGANLGKVDVNGYEVVLGFNHKFNKDFSLFSDFNFTYAKDIILYREDPLLTPVYQQQAGYPIGQTHSAITGKIMQNWDDIYMSTPLSANNAQKRPGYYDLIDFNGDGNYNGTYDNTAYGYPNRPEKTWSWTIGGGYKGLSISVQFYGQSNTTRNYTLNDFAIQTHIFFAATGNYWSVNNPNGTQTLASWSLNPGATDPNRNLIDGSMVRLKMAEIAYRLDKKTCKYLGLQGLKIFVNGNDLYLWSKMADDRDYNNGNTNVRGDYPMLKRYNVGFNLDL